MIISIRVRKTSTFRSGGMETIPLKARLIHQYWSCNWGWDVFHKVRLQLKLGGFWYKNNQVKEVELITKMGPSCLEIYCSSELEKRLHRDRVKEFYRVSEQCLVAMLHSCISATLFAEIVWRSLKFYIHTLNWKSLMFMLAGVGRSCQTNKLIKYKWMPGN